MFPLLSVYYSTCAGGNHQYSGFLFSSPIFLVRFLYLDQASCFFCCIFYSFWSVFQHSFWLLSQFLVSRFLYFYRDTGPCSDPGFHQKFSFFLFKQLQPFSDIRHTITAAWLDLCILQSLCLGFLHTAAIVFNLNDRLAVRPLGTNSKTHILPVTVQDTVE